jgi:serine/threonine protein kinase
MKMSKHPNVVRLSDFFEDAENFYLILEYMGGGDLFDYLKSRSFRLSEERSKEITYQLVLAVQFLHSFGIVHRDIKLENVMMSDVSDLSVPKIADFGLAKIVGPTEKADEPFGTLGYAAPEVLRKEPYGPACDLWSLGCICHALLCGSLPFDHDSQRETARLTLQGRLLFD